MIHRISVKGIGIAIAAGAVWFGLATSPANGAADPASQAAAGSKATTAPHATSEHPDLSGIWHPAAQGGGAAGCNYDKINDKVVNGKAPDSLNPNDPDDNLGRLRAAKCFSDNAHKDAPHYKADFQAKVDNLDHYSSTLYPAFYCVPRGVPGIGAPEQIIQFPDKVVFLYGGTMNFRLIPIDKPHNPDADPSLMGDSVAHWEGNTLVVDVNNFDDLQWLGSSGWFHTTDMHVVERFTREGNMLTYQVSVEDSVLAEPWVHTRKMKLSTDPADALTEEGPCVEKDAEHLVNHDHD